MSEHVPIVLLHQRIREGIIDYLEWVSDYQKQKAYQAAVPYVWIPNEAINQWEDWVSEERFDTYGAPVFSSQEQICMREFHRIWEAVTDETPEDMPALDDLIGTALWERLRLAAEHAYDIFMRRGRFDRDTIQFPDHNEN